MTPDTIPQTVLFPDLFDKPLFAQFNQEQASSDGGAVLLKAAERAYGLVKALAGCLFDTRAPDKIRHTLADLFGQRIFGIACGHPDCNDAERLADDPIHKLLLGRDPEAGEPLASQPTLSRFENAVNRCALYRMADELARRVIERHRRRLDGRARCITIDLDPTDDPTHGAQQYTLFNAYYDNWCYLPLLAFVTFDRESDEYQAGTWNHARRVVLKAEVVRLGDREPRDNPRFVVTNLRQTPRFIYEKVYCARGDVENRIKELKALQIDRTSCQVFSANQLRVLLTAAAYVLMQELRLCAAGTACARAQVPWLRDRLLKLGVQVVRSVRRIVLHLPRATPDLAAWRHIAFALGARAG